MKKIYVYQIFYDATSRAKIQPGFIPIDNTNSKHSDWFEFWVILNFLRNNALEEGAWYGFLSPKFFEKTGIDSATVLKAIEENDESTDVAIFSTAWDQLAYFLNPWEQGEVWHPGLTALTQNFLAQYGFNTDLRSIVTDSANSVFSNYLIAKKDFWTAWHDLAEKFFSYVETNADQHPEFTKTTSYGSNINQYPMKTFIQERFSSLLLADGRYRVLVADQSSARPIFSRIFSDDQKTRYMLQTCDLMKSKYRETLDTAYIDMYWRIRNAISYYPPVM